MKVAIYARVSRDDNIQDPQNQIKPCKSFAEAMGWDVNHIFIDYASGGSANRPEFQKMLGQIRQRRFDLVLIWALDRFSREGMRSTLSYIQQLRKYKCGLKSMQENWLDTTNEGVGELMIGIFAWVAKQESDRIAERTKEGIKRKRSKGFTWGRPPGSKDKKKRKARRV